MGAWIEIFMVQDTHPADRVAPLVGAWIEINKGIQADRMVTSLLSWERGLKYLQANERHGA